MRKIAFVIALLLGVSACTAVRMMSYYQDHRRNPSATIQQSENKKYRYRIELTDHVVYHGNPRLQTSDVTEDDEKLWIYLNSDNGQIDAAGDSMAATIVLGDFTAGKLKGFVKIAGDQLTVSLSSLMYGDGRPTDKWVSWQPYNGIYHLVRAPNQAPEPMSGLAPGHGTS